MESVWGILLRIAPPVMLAQLIQAMYNIVDSYFVGQYSGAGLTALSVVYPVQLIVTAIAIGTGVGVNTQMSRYYGQGKERKADKTAGTGTALAILSWVIFASFSVAIMRPYAMISADSQEVVDYAVLYGTIVCAGSLGVFLESTWSKVHQAGGNMRLPMAAQIAGALTNIVLDPILIFGLGPVPELGVAGAAYATVAGQVLAAVITCSGFHRPPPLRQVLSYAGRIYRLGYPSILMQMLFTIYIMALTLKDGQTMVGLSQFLDLDTSNTNHVIKVLRERDLVCDDRVDQSRKKFRIFLTPEGRLLGLYLMDFQTNVVNECFKGISDEEILFMRNIMIRLLENIDPDLENYMQSRYQDPFYTYLHVDLGDDKFHVMNHIRRHHREDE